MNTKKHLRNKTKKVCQSAFAVIFVAIFIIFGGDQVNAQSRAKSKTKKAAKQKETKAKSKVAENGEKDRVKTIVRNGKTYYLNEERDLKRFDKPSEAQESYRNKRLSKGMSEVPVDRYFSAIEKIKEMKRFSTADGKIYPSEKDAPGLKEKTSGEKTNWDEKSGNPACTFPTCSCPAATRTATSPFMPAKE